MPDVGNLPWEAIAEYREHPGSDEARGAARVRGSAAAADPDDPLEFQRDAFREISRALFAAIEDLEGSLTKDLAAEAAKTPVSFIPLFGPFIGPGVSVARAVADEIQERRTWYAALMKLIPPAPGTQAQTPRPHRGGRDLAVPTLEGVWGMRRRRAGPIRLSTYSARS